MGTEGRNSLATLSKEVTDFYISQLNSENFQVREVATECFDEIFKNVAASHDTEAYRPHIHIIIESLVQRAKDLEWNVRRGIFLTIGEIINVYPEEVKNMPMCG